MRMRADKWCRGLMTFLVVPMLIGMYPSSAVVSDYKLGYNTDAGEDDYVSTTKLPKGTMRKSMFISFRIRVTNEDMENLCISLPGTNKLQQMEGRGNEDHSVDYYPSEIMGTTFVAKNVGTIKEGSVKSVSLSARAWRDALQGHYNVPVLLEWDGGFDTDHINVWIFTSSTSGADEEEDEKEGNYFVVGGNQSTPRGVYLNTIDYAVNFRNKRETMTQDAAVSMQLSEDDAKLPSKINDSNYDRISERVQPGEAVPTPYGMVIRKDFYTGYYSIKYTTTLCSSSEENLHMEEGTFYVHVTFKDKEDDLGNFNANNRTRARLIAESYRTVPEKIYVGDEFELILNMKNVSTLVAVSNTLSNSESEKVLNSVVFITESGTPSPVADDMAPGQTTEVRARFIARAGVDQRSYAVTAKERYDSPELENAEEDIVVDILVKQYTRLSTSTIDVMPDSLIVGPEPNIMSGTSNTGKVTLYNVTTTLEADSAKTTDAYVGDIKPDEAGNADTMLTGMVPIPDEGMVHIRIGYEDESGIPVEPVEKESTLMVIEEIEQNQGDMGAAMDAGSMEAEAAPSFWGRHKSLVIVGAAAVADTAAVVIIRIRKKRKAAREKNVDDEIS